MSASSSMMFSVPAIFILGYGMDFNPILMTFGAIAGAFMGIGFIIPLRKQMIDYERLTYPGGVAVAGVVVAFPKMRCRSSFCISVSVVQPSC